MISFFRDSRASVTPAMCIVLASIVLVNFAMLDAVRISSLRKLLQGKQELAAFSVLANFDNILQQDYGLYAVHDEDFDYVENRFYDIIKDSANEFGVSSFFENEKFPRLNIMEFDVLSSKVIPEKYLDDCSVLKEQISSVMKYQSTSNIIKEIAAQVAGLTGLTSMAGIYGKYLTVSQLYDEYKAGIAELEIAINGSIEFSPNCVNGIEMFPCCKDDDYIETVSKYLLPEGAVYDRKAAEALKNVISLYTGPSGIFLQYNEKASELCSSLSELVSDSENKIVEIEKWLEENEPEEDYEEAFAESIEKMINEIRNSYLKTSLGAIRTKTSNNSLLINSAYSEWISIEKAICANSVIPSEKIVSLIETFSYTYKKYQTVNFPKEKAESMDAAEYADYLLDAEATKAIQIALDFESVTIPNDLYKTLPSVEASGCDNVFLSSLDSCKNLDNIESIFDVISECGDIGSLIDVGATSALEAYYINDYIMTYFSSAADRIRKYNHYMKDEVEYIICGAASEKSNLESVYAKLLELRIAFNIVHIICDSEKLQAAGSAGKALSAVSSGMGASVYTAIIIASWAAAESAVDVADLVRGNSVPLIKKKGDWRTSVAGLTFGSSYLENKDAVSDGFKEESFVTESDDIFAMDYDEYLHLLLIQVPEKIKLQRIQDIIELNLYKASNTRIYISEFYTAVKCYAKYEFDTFVYFNSDNYKKYFVEGCVYANT